MSTNPPRTHLTSASANTSATVTPPTTLATSHEIRDRGSTFVGYVYRARTVDEAKATVAMVAGDRHPADALAGVDDETDDGLRGTRETGQDSRDDVEEEIGLSYVGGSHVSEQAHTHTQAQAQTQAQAHGGTTRTRTLEGDVRSCEYVMAAWRCMAVKPGRTGLSGPDDFAVEQGSEDGGEKWAGGRVLGVMKREGVIDAVVVVCRWFGGTLLGPVRFAHIETCASEVCRRFKKIEEMDACIQTLRTLDDLLATLRAELATAREGTVMQDLCGVVESSGTKRKVPDYFAMQQSLDLTKAKRLIHARECGINATKALIEKCKTST